MRSPRFSNSYARAVSYTDSSNPGPRGLVNPKRRVHDLLCGGVGAHFDQYRISRKGAKDAKGTRPTGKLLTLTQGNYSILHGGWARQRKGKSVKSAEWEVTVERPTFDLTIFKLHCGKLTLKIYTKGERVLRMEAMAHNIHELDCGRILERFPRIVSRLKGVLERFVNALSWVDQCFISDDALEQLPAPWQIGKSKVGGIDFNKSRMRWAAEAVLALATYPNGFTATYSAAKVHTSSTPT